MVIAGLLLISSVVPVEAGKLTISTGMWVGYGALYLARDLGYFRTGGLDVELTQSSDFFATITALAADQISGSAAQVDLMLQARGRVCVKGVVTLDDSSGADGILAADDIGSLDQMKGKEIAVYEAGAPNVFFNYALEQAGLARSDVTVLNMRPEDAAAAFMAGRVAVAVTYEPSLTFARNAHRGRILYTSRAAPGLIADLVYLRCALIEQQPDDVAALVKGLLEADDYIAAHPDEAYDIMRKYVGGFLGTRADFAGAATGVTYYGRALNHSYLGSLDAPGDVMKTVEFVTKVWNTGIPTYTYADLFDPRYLDP